jgi:hypothetical protein
MLRKIIFQKTLLLAVLIANMSMAQEKPTSQINLSGKWAGTSNWGKQQMTMRLEIKQTGNLLEGRVGVQTLNKKKSAIYLVNGFIKESVVAMKATKFEEKTGAWCLPSFEIKFILDSNNEKLTGRWKNNNVKEGCWPGVSGRVDLIKIQVDKAEDLAPTVVSRTTTIADSDREGNALSEELQKRDYYALIIAVQDYPDQSVVDLDQPVSDAKSLRDELITDYTFEQQNITLLENPSRASIIETFDKLTATVQSTDNLLVFYAGHGVWDEQIEQGYWLPSDAKKSSKAAWLSNGTIRDYIRAIDSKHTLLITDACFGGGILKTREAFQSSKAMLEMYKLPSRKAMTSGALKTVPDKSVFIEYLIKALKSNDQPLISADQLFTTFKYNVINNSPNGQVPQYGVISQADDEGGDFIFLKKE